MHERERLEVERRFYDDKVKALDPADYDWRSGVARVEPVFRRAYRHAEDWLWRRCAGRRVLDLGTGHGVFAVHPARCGARVTGIDISARSIEMARRRAAREDVAGHVTYAVADCGRLPFGSGTFDIVTAYGVMSCLDLGVAVAEIARVLAADGQALIVDTLGHNPLLNVRRAAATRRGERTAWTRDHILRMSDVTLLRERFRASRARFFDLVTPGVAVVGRQWRRLPERVVGAAEGADAALLRVPFLRRYAFKFVLELEGPRKDDDTGRA